MSSLPVAEAKNLAVFDDPTFGKPWRNLRVNIQRDLSNLSARCFINNTPTNYAIDVGQQEIACANALIASSSSCCDLGTESGQLQRSAHMDVRHRKWIREACLAYERLAVADTRQNNIPDSFDFVSRDLQFCCKRSPLDQEPLKAGLVECMWCVQIHLYEIKGGYRAEGPTIAATICSPVVEVSAEVLKVANRIIQEFQTEKRSYRENVYTLFSSETSLISKELSNKTQDASQTTTPAPTAGLDTTGCTTDNASLKRNGLPPDSSLPPITNASRCPGTASSDFYSVARGLGEAQNASGSFQLPPSQREEEDEDDVVEAIRRWSLNRGAQLIASA